jgi:hypothetical protein
MFNSNQYVQQVRNTPLWDLIATYAYVDLQIGKITLEEWVEVLKVIDSLPDVQGKSSPTDHTQVEEYLKTVVNRATPEAIRAAKKSLKGYCEYLIYQDEKQGRISANTATAAKAALPAFLSKIRPPMNEN